MRHYSHFLDRRPTIYMAFGRTTNIRLPDTSHIKDARIHTSIFHRPIVAEVLDVLRSGMDHSNAVYPRSNSKSIEYTQHGRSELSHSRTDFHMEAD